MRTILLLTLIAAFVLLSGCCAAQPRGMGYMPTLLPTDTYYAPPINNSQTIYLR